MGSPSTATRGAAWPEREIDAALPVGDDWRVFRLGTQRHARIPGSPEAWAGSPAGSPTDSSAVPSVLPTSPLALTFEWLQLAAPAGPFRPVQAVPAQRGYFLLVDAASGRLCLYDDNAGLISTFPLPEEFVPFAAGRVAVFRGADGAFTFVDYGTGEARQFADRQTSGAGATRWIARGKVKLPAGTRACAQPPGSEDLFCRGADGTPLRFDGALNRVSVRMPSDAADRTDARAGARAEAKWDVEAGEWALEGRAADGTALFRFLPAQRRWKGAPSPATP